MTNIQILILAGVLFTLALILFLSCLFKDNKIIDDLRKELNDEKRTSKEVLSQLDYQLSSMETVHAEYCVSESDKLKYKNDKVMENAIKTKLAMLIANDIIKKLGSPTKVSDEKYIYSFKLSK